MVRPDGRPRETGWTKRTERITTPRAQRQSNGDRVDPRRHEGHRIRPRARRHVCTRTMHWEKRTRTESAADSFMGLVVCQGKSHCNARKSEALMRTAQEWIAQVVSPGQLGKADITSGACFGADPPWRRICVPPRWRMPDGPLRHVRNHPRNSLRRDNPARWATSRPLRKGFCGIYREYPLPSSLDIG
jgi:hypothetical protein